MTCHVEQGVRVSRDTDAISQHGVVTYTLTTGENGTALTGTGDTCVFTAATSGYVRVSGAAATKAAAATNHRVIANVARTIVGVAKGDFVSYLADS